MELRWARLDGRGGHEMGRALLEEMAGVHEIRVTETGKPYFADSPLHFSVSHTKNHVFVCLSHKNCGIDGEETDRPVRPSVIGMLSDAEKARVTCDADLLKLWVLKEAYAKLTGRGIGNYLKNTDFSPDDRAVKEIDGCYVAVLEE